ncbi:MAG: hypothetical protein GDA53_10275 [Rhodobacteraceae bacterium]|nr:hypothetical protein [Paracoccaceae bacterium]
MENKLKHLEFAQHTITRMATSSFLIKGWTVTLAAAFLALSAGTADKNYVLLALIPSILFWGLDGYYLWQERRFRILYDVIRVRDPDTIDFAMHYTEVDSSDKGWLAATFSRTLWGFHGGLTISVAIVALRGILNGTQVFL